MAVFIPVKCPKCGDGESIVKFGQTSNGKQRFFCQNKECDKSTFILNHERKGWLPEVKEKIIEMALNGSGIRDTARVLGICTETVISELKKKEKSLQSVNLKLLGNNGKEDVEVDIVKVEEAEADEMWSFIGKKKNQRWLWHAIDHRTGEVLAYVFGKHNDDVLLKIKGLLEPFGITKFYTDGWGGYERHIPEEHLSIGKSNTQKIERKHLTLRTRIKRLARKTICFSKSERMHDIVIGLFINRYEFAIPI